MYRYAHHEDKTWYLHEYVDVCLGHRISLHSAGAELWWTGRMPVLPGYH